MLSPDLYEKYGSNPDFSLSTKDQHQDPKCSKYMIENYPSLTYEQQALP